MILEAQIEQQILDVLSRMESLKDYQLMTSRQQTEYSIEEEDKSKKGVLVIASGFRSNDNFSLTTINVSLSLVLMTRIELDPTAQIHETAIEEIANQLSYWHKYGDEMTEDLSVEKALVSELTMNGGSGRTCDKSTRCWSETINFNLRGSEIFNK